ncbi:MAG: hypothetical protein ABIK89_04995 [Planctomycetota bacterium]
MAKFKVKQIEDLEGSELLCVYGKADATGDDVAIIFYPDAKTRVDVKTLIEILSRAAEVAVGDDAHQAIFPEF